MDFDLLYRFEDWDKNFEDIKLKTRDALDAIDMDELQRLEEKSQFKKSNKGDPKYGPTQAQKNTFRYRRADFRQSKAYEKLEIQYMNSSYPRPPTPIFDDFDSPLEANKGQLISEGNFDRLQISQKMNQIF